MNQFAVQIRINTAACRKQTIDIRKCSDIQAPFHRNSPAVDDVSLFCHVVSVPLCQKPADFVVDALDMRKPHHILLPDAPSRLVSKNDVRSFGFSDSVQQLRKLVFDKASHLFIASLFFFTHTEKWGQGKTKRLF